MNNDWMVAMDYRIKINKLIEYLFIAGTILVMFRGQTILVGYSNLILLLLALLSLYSNFSNGFYYIKRKKSSTPICLFLLVGCLSIMWSADPDSSKTMFLIFGVLILIMQYDFSDDFWKKFFIFGEVISLIVAISIFFEVIVPNHFIDIFQGILFRPSNTLKQVMLGEYSGLAGGNAHAGVILNFGFVITLARCYVNEKIRKEDIIKFLVFALAIFLTGKRTLILTPVIMLIVYYCSGNTKNKYFKLIMFVLLGGALGYIFVQLIPEFAEAIDKFVQGESETDILTGRGNFWKICVVMFLEKPVLGYGISTFNHVFYEKTQYLFAGIPWEYHAHSIYYQICAELGVVGIGLFVLQLVVIIKKYIQFLRLKNDYTDSKQNVLFFGINMVLFLSVYGLTGNVLYETDEVFGLIIGIIAVEYAVRNKDKGNNEKQI